MEVRTNQGDTVDALCWRHLGATQGVVEETLEMNPGLAKLGPILSAGLLVQLPEKQKTPTRRAVNLWD